MYYTEKLLYLRECEEKTQEQIANAIGLKREQYRRYENGINEMPIRILTKLCRYYNVSADYILDLPRDLPYPKR